MSLTNVSFYNIKTVTIQPRKFPTALDGKGFQSMELTLKDNDGNEFSITVFGDSTGGNTMPEISFLPTVTY